MELVNRVIIWKYRGQARDNNDEEMLDFDITNIPQLLFPPLSPTLEEQVTKLARVTLA